METKRKTHIDVLKFFTKLSLQIVVLFLIAIAYSFGTEYLQYSGFFGDIKLEKPNRDGCDNMHEWGMRHYLYHAMSILLFIIQFVRIIVFAIVEGAYTFDDDVKKKMQ